MRPKFFLTILFALIGAALSTIFRQAFQAWGIFNPLADAIGGWLNMHVVAGQAEWTVAAFLGACLYAFALFLIWRRSPHNKSKEVHASYSQQDLSRGAMGRDIHISGGNFRAGDGGSGGNGGDLIIRARDAPGTGPKLNGSFSMYDPGCVRRIDNLPASTDSSTTTTTITVFSYAVGDAIEKPPEPKPQSKAPSPFWRTNYYRVKVEALGTQQIEGCRGRLLSIRRGTIPILEGEAIDLPFALANQPDALCKTIRSGAPEYLDFLTITDDNTVLVTTPGFIGPSSIDWGALFLSPGEYHFDIRIMSQLAPPEPVHLLFKWTGTRSTSDIIQCP